MENGAGLGPAGIAAMLPLSFGLGAAAGCGAGAGAAELSTFSALVAIK